MIWIFQRVQRVKIKATSFDLAEREANRDDCPWDVGEVELLDQEMDRNE